MKGAVEVSDKAESMNSGLDYKNGGLKHLLLFISKIPVWIRTFLSLLMLTIVLLNINLLSVMQEALAADRRFFLVWLCGYIVMSFLMTCKWRSLLRRQPDIDVPSIANLYLKYWSSDSLNLLGLGSVLGDFHRAVSFSNSKKKVLLVNYVDKAVSLLWYFMFGLFLLSIELPRFGMLFLLLVFILIFVKTKLSKKLRFYFSSEHFLWSLACAGALGLLYSFSFNLVSVNLSVPQSILYAIGLNIILTLPISFSGIGARELFTITYMQYLGFAPEKALIVTTIALTANLIYKALGGIFLVSQSRLGFFTGNNK